MLTAGDLAQATSLLFGSSPLDFCNDGTFTIGSEVSIHLGYKDDVHEVFAGEVTGFAPRLDEYSAPLMEVKIHSKLHRLNKGTRCASFEHKTPAGIIRDIVQGYNLNADVEDFGPEYNYIEQKNFTDYGYIMYLAGKYGKTVYCNRNTVHVKTEIAPTDDDVVLEWGKTIISARTKIDLAAQLSAVTATGWDMRKCSGFMATATMKDVPLKIGGEYCWEDNAKGYDSHKVGQLSSSSFTDEKDALEVARSVLLGRSMQFQSCEAKTEGNCRIRPGNRLTVRYLGMHSDGEYLVQLVEHDFSVQDGYFTTCHLKRNFCEVGNNRSITEIDRERINSQGAKSEGNVAFAGSGKQTETQNDTEESNVEEKSPKISNPRWEDENGKAITKALVGDEVYLCADVTDIADGATAKIKVIEKDGDGNDDFVAELGAAVQEVSVDTITFAYDFGDGWTFPIRLEEIIDDKVYEEVSPLILDGEGLGIIEDVGGVGAMSDCVKAFEKKSGEDYSEWLGLKDLDITYFNKCAVNKSLKNEIKAIDKAYKTME